MKNHRFHELDALRAIAAIGVICWHYVNTYHTAPFGHLLAPFYGRGLLMVHFFFVLSGFVLARAFWTDRRSSAFLPNIWARIARIYPLHFVILCAVALMQWYLVTSLGHQPFTYTENDLYHFVLNLLLLNWSGLQAGFSFNGPSWSISTEFLINILFFVVIAQHRRLAKAAILMIALSAIATAGFRGVIDGTKAFGWLDNGLIITAAGFFLGVMLNDLYCRLGEPRWSWRWDGLSLGLLAALFWYLSSNRLWSNTNDMITCYVAFPLLILSVLRSKFTRMALRQRPLILLGEASYSIYLIHFPVFLAIDVLTAQFGFDLPVEDRWFFVALMALIVALSLVTYRYIELPSKQLLMTKARVASLIPSRT